MNAQDNDAAIQRYSLGQRLGNCLVTGCVVFTGVVRSLGAPAQAPGEPDPQRAIMLRKVSVRVSEWLYGAGTGETLDLQHAERPAMGKSGLGPWQAWDQVKLEVGAELLVVRWARDAPRPTWQTGPEDVALALSDKRLFPALREAVHQHRRFEHEPDEIVRAPQLLRDRQDPFFTGYLLSYLMNGEGVRQVDRAAVLLASVLAHEAVPAPGRTVVAGWLSSTFYRLGDATRKTVTEALVVSASAEDAGLAQPALGVLVRLGELRLLELRPALNPARQARLLDNYRAAQATNTLQQERAEFERQLGLR